MTKYITEQFTKELPEDFPDKVAIITSDTNNVIEMSSEEMGIHEDDDFPIIILCKGLVSVTSRNGRKTKYKRWSYTIHVLESNETLIEVHVFPIKKEEATKISSNIYLTSEVFKGFPSLFKLNQSVKNKILGNE